MHHPLDQLQHKLFQTQFLVWFGMVLLALDSEIQCSDGSSLIWDITSSPRRVETKEVQNFAELEFGLTGVLFDNHTAPGPSPHPKEGLELILS